MGSGSSRISTVNNGIDTSLFAGAKATVGLKDGLPDGTQAITMVAGFRWEKDQDTLIKAMGELPGNFHLYLVGDGVRREECARLAESTGVAKRVHFLGLRTDVPAILKASDYIVMSSHFEGLSLSSLEGMSAGKPFLASDVDGLREVVGGAGILFPHQDHRAFAEAIMRLHDDQELYSEVAYACGQRAAAYDISKMVEGYIKVYDGLWTEK